jgi:mannose-6-phosphate isomerase-like protein (cupin superfamily)
MTTFPGGTAVTLLDVYDDAASDGVSGGSPHLHLVSTEAYVVIGGLGELHTVGAAGFERTRLFPGSIAWFTPGTIHRVVNSGDLHLAVIMSNAGLPEAGDAVMTFPEAFLIDRETYEDAARLPTTGDHDETARAAARRRDLAVDGYLPIMQAARRGDLGPYRHFQAQAAGLVRSRADDFRRIVEDGPAAHVSSTFAALGRLTDDAPGFVAEAQTYAVDLGRDRAYGMCGRLRPLHEGPPGSQRQHDASSPGAG